MSKRGFDPRKARAATGGGNGEGWYQSIPVPDNRLTCSRCGIKSATVRHTDMVCILCWMKARAEARGEKILPIPEHGGEGDRAP
jgi:hypothetical protein